MADGTGQSRLEMGQRLIAEHRVRINRQQQFLEDLAISRHCDNVIRDAAESLRQMTANLNVMSEKIRQIAEGLSADGMVDNAHEVAR